MYFRRYIDPYLKEWKESARRKPLLLRGARQVGKSRSIRHLGESFAYFAEVNFETRPELRQIFKEVSDVREIVSRLGTLLNIPIIEDKTLLFLDEIQACPEALHSLWAFKENMPRLHVAAAGSLLEFTLKEMPSFGVGRIRSMFMYPMSFDEFLMASGLDSWITVKNKADYQHPLSPELHQALVQQFRSFLMVGGMPASVAAWIDTHDYMQSAEEQEDIQQTYYDDFAKYSSKIDPQLLRNTLRSVVMQTGSKFVYSRVEGGYRSEEVKRALTMLCDAGIVKMVQHSAGNGLGWEIIKSLTPRTEHDLYYWENTAESTTSEVDYLLVQDLQIIPVEVKSGVTGKMKSLRLFMRRKHLLYGKRCSLENFGILEFTDAEDPLHATESKRIFIHPLYCLSTLNSLMV